MGKSPNRKDTAYAMALFSDEIKLSDSDIEKIEKTCGIRILKKDREYLNRLLDSYRTNKKLEENSSTKKEQIEALERIMTASGTLNELFSDEGNHAIRRATHRIEDNFSKTIEKHGFDLKARWDIFFSHIHQEQKHFEREVLNFPVIADHMLIIKYAAKMAISDIESKVNIDKGGKNEDYLYNALLSHLDEFSKRKKVKRGTKDTLFYTVINTIHKIDKKMCPAYDWVSIKKRLSRKSDKKSSQK